MATTPDLSKIVTAAIHPSIGLARVGNSQNEWFLGPEVSYPNPQDLNTYRDSKGAIKRQAARFRVYGYDADGKVVAELNADNAAVNWEVHVANKKSSWYVFNTAMDIPEAVPVPLRNSNISGEDREDLNIDPGPRSITGKSINNGNGFKKYAFDTGKFLGEDVYLGELQTDEKGRLLFLGGRGVSQSVYNNNFITGYGNEDGWYDDISDGPVRASVTLNDGRSIDVTSAWVYTAPVAYAPDFKNIVTLWDCIYDAFVQGEVLSLPPKVSFCKDVYPIFYRLSSYQWLNQGYNIAFGYNGPYDFENPSFVSKLADESPYSQEIKRQILRRFRNPDTPVPEWDKWPWNYGDDASYPPITSPRQYLSITKTQYQILQMWLDGNFINDWDKWDEINRKNIDDYDEPDQPEVLDKASLNFGVGGPFHPGAGVTWPMRHVSMYSMPFRIREREDHNPPNDYGKVLIPKEAVSLGGPLYFNGPGDVTRWMTVPWQPDLAACRYAYFGEDPYMPSFWASRSPNQVLTFEDYEFVMNDKNDRKERIERYYNRKEWYRFLNGGTLNQMNQILTEYINQGFIIQKKGIADDPDFPSVMFVEEPMISLRGIVSPTDANSNFDYSLILQALKKMAHDSK